MNEDFIHRFLSGVNVYAYSPVLEVEIDLEKYDQVRAGMFPVLMKACWPIIPALPNMAVLMDLKGAFSRD